MEISASSFVKKFQKISKSVLSFLSRNHQLGNLFAVALITLVIPFTVFVASQKQAQEIRQHASEEAPDASGEQEACQGDENYYNQQTTFAYIADNGASCWNDWELRAPGCSYEKRGDTRCDDPPAPENTPAPEEEVTPTPEPTIEPPADNPGDTCATAPGPKCTNNGYSDPACCLDDSQCDGTDGNPPNPFGPSCGYRNQLCRGSACGPSQYIAPPEGDAFCSNKENIGKCDSNDAWNPVCCESDNQCANGQSCSVGNGFCRSGTSCNTDAQPQPTEEAIPAPEEQVTTAEGCMLGDTLYKKGETYCDTSLGYAGRMQCVEQNNVYQFVENDCLGASESCQQDTSTTTSCLKRDNQCSALQLTDGETGCVDNKVLVKCSGVNISYPRCDAGCAGDVGQAYCKDSPGGEPAPTAADEEAQPVDATPVPNESGDEVARQPAQPVTVGECTPGEHKCEANAINQKYSYSCNNEGKWAQPTYCYYCGDAAHGAEPGMCPESIAISTPVPATPTPQQFSCNVVLDSGATRVMRSNEVRCMDGAIYACPAQGGNASSPTACPSNQCENDNQCSLPSPTPEGPLCSGPAGVKDETRCDGSRVQICTGGIQGGFDGWYDSGRLCSLPPVPTAAPIPTSEPRCQNPEGIFGDKMCRQVSFGGVVLQEPVGVVCKATKGTGGNIYGGGWIQDDAVTKELCPTTPIKPTPTPLITPQDCDFDVTKITAGSKSCIDDSDGTGTLYTCDVNPSTNRSMPIKISCSYGCGDDHASCSDTVKVCTPGAHQCKSHFGNVRWSQVCDAKGQWQDEERCTNCDAASGRCNVPTAIPTERPTPTPKIKTDCTGPAGSLNQNYCDGQRVQLCTGGFQGGFDGWSDSGRLCSTVTSPTFVPIPVPLTAPVTTQCGVVTNGTYIACPGGGGGVQ